MTDPTVEIHVHVHLQAAGTPADWVKAAQRVRWLRKQLSQPDGDVAITVEEPERGLVPTGEAG